MPFQPAMEEPSKAWPDSNLSASKCETGTPTCCSLPRVSVKRRSTNLMPCSLISFKTSAAVLDILESPKKNVTKLFDETKPILQELCHHPESRKARIVPYLARASLPNQCPQMGRFGMVMH